MISTEPVQQPTQGLAARLRFRNWHITTKLLLVILILALIPLLLATVVSARSSSRALTDQTRISLSRLANTVALRMSQAVAAAHQSMQLVAGDPQIVAFLGAPPEKRSDVLRANLDAAVANLLVAVPAIDSVGIYDSTGTTMAHSDPTTVGRNVSTRDFVQAALAGQTFTSSFRRDPVNDTFGINISAPVRNNGQVVGAVALHIRGEFIDDLLNKSLSVEGTGISQDQQAAIKVFLVDGHGIVVSSQGQPGWLYRSLGNPSTGTLRAIAADRPLGVECARGAADCAPDQETARQPAPIPAAQPLGEQLLAAIASGQAGSYRYCSPDSLEAAWVPDRCQGDWHVVGYAPVTAPPATASGAVAPLLLVAVDLSEASFLAPVAAQRLEGFAIAAVIGLLAVVASLLTARSLTRRIRHLAATASEVENDGPFTPDQLSSVAASGDEIGQLARVFSSMVIALRSRVAELRSIYDIGRTITSSVDVDETLTFIVTSLRGAIPYDAAEICLLDRGQNRLVARVAAAEEAVHKVDQLYAPDEYFTARLSQERTGVLIPDLTSAAVPEAQPKRSWADMDPQTYLGVPLIVKDEVIGTIEMVSHYPNGLTEDNLRVLESVAIQASVAIQNAQEVQAREIRLKQQIDALTIQIDEMKREKQVQEIVETEYFQKLRGQAAQLRQTRKDQAEPP